MQQLVAVISRRAVNVMTIQAADGVMTAVPQDLVPVWMAVEVVHLVQMVLLCAPMIDGILHFALVSHIAFASKYLITDLVLLNNF
jgi:hypothetical protein